MMRVRKILRTLWITFGILFILFMADSYRARGFDPAVLKSNSLATVEETHAYLCFRPESALQSTGVIFYPGAMVPPEAYAPMARALAEQGFLTCIVRLPFGFAPLETHQDNLNQRTLVLQTENHEINTWVVGGHSRGGALAARFAHQYGQRLAGLILIGTSHPKEDVFRLSDRSLVVTKIYATKDGLAGQSEVEANSDYLPAGTRWVKIVGGNHAQFGYYGRQLGDQAADISRAQQQERMLEAIFSTLNSIQAH